MEGSLGAWYVHSWTSFHGSRVDAEAAKTHTSWYESEGHGLI